MSGQDLPRVRTAVRRGIWAVATELVDSASNFLLSVVIARAVGPREFGAFGIVYVSLQLVLLMSRASASMAMMIDGPLGRDGAGRDIAARVLGITLATGLVGSLAGLVVAAVAHGVARPLLFAGAVSLPGVLLVDCCCYVFFARREPRHAFVSQATWLAAQVVTFVMIANLFESKRAWVFLMFWGTASYLAVLTSLVMLGVRPRLGGGWAWWRDRRQTVRDLVAEATVGQAAQQLIVYILGLGVSVASVGAYRAAQLPFGLLRSLFQGLVPIGVVEGAQLRHTDPYRLRRLMLAWDAGVVALTVGLGFVLWLMPQSVGQEMFGASWGRAHDVLLVMMCASTASSVIVPVQTALRALGATRQLLHARAVLTAAQVAGLCAGVVAGGLRPALAGLAVGYAIGAVAAWMLLTRATREAALSSQRH